MVHAGNDCVIKGTLESALIDIMLVLADADGFRVDFDQLGQRIHKAAANGNGSAHCEIEVREFLTSNFRGGINRSARLAHHHDHKGCRQAERADECFRLAGSSAIADGDGLDFIAIHKRLDDFSCLGTVAGPFFGIDHLVGEEFTLGIEHSEFATGAEAGINGENDLLTKRRGQEELAKVFSKNPDRFLIGFLFVEKPSLTLHGKAEKALETILRCEANLSGRWVCSLHKKIVECGEGLLLWRIDAREKHTLGFTTTNCQKAVRRALGDGFAPVKVVLELRCLGFLIEDDLGF